MLRDAATIVSGLGWATLHSLWIGALVSIILFVVYRCGSKPSATHRYRIGWYALVAITFVTVIATMHYAEIRTYLLAKVSDALVAANDNFANDNTWIGVEYKQSADHFALFDRVARTLGLASYLIGFAWLLGLLITASRMLAAWWVLAGIVRRSTPLAARALAKWNLDRMVQRPKGRVELRVSSAIRSPFVFGFHRPVIVVPLSLLSSREDAQVKSVLLHEIAHVQRSDPFTNFFLVTIEAGFHLNPFVLWIVSILREERECCCDRIAATNLGDRFVYARALVDLQESFQAHDERFALGIGQNSLSRRIERLCGETRPKLAGCIKQGCVVSSLSLLACTCSGFVAVVRDIDQALVRKPDLQTINQSLIAEYSLDGNAIDLSGNNHHGEVRGCTSIPDRHGNPNSALFLDGKADIVKIPNCKELENYSTFTATSWIKTDRGEHKWMSWLAKSNLNNRRSQWRIGFGGENGEWGFSQFTHAARATDGKASFALWASDCEIGAQWTHMTAVVNADEGWVKLFVNGKLSGKIDQVKPFIVDHSPLYIGYQRDEKSYFKGAIDDVKIYGRSLSDAEVLTAYHEESSH